MEPDAIEDHKVLETRLECKKAIGEIKNERVDVPIGIILTKADTLPNPDIDPETLVHEKMRRFENALHSIHSGPKSFFKVHVDIERDENNEVGNTELELRVPLTYSHDSYVDILWWIHQEIRG